MKKNLSTDEIAYIGKRQLGDYLQNINNLNILYRAFLFLLYKLRPYCNVCEYDVISIANVIGKANNGDISELKRWGVPIQTEEITQEIDENKRIIILIKKINEYQIKRVYAETILTARNY